MTVVRRLCLDGALEYLAGLPGSDSLQAVDSVACVSPITVRQVLTYTAVHDLGFKQANEKDRFHGVIETFYVVINRSRRHDDWQ